VNRLWPALILFAGTAVSAADRIADIEFFAYKGIDLDAVRKALPKIPGILPATPASKP